MINKPTLINRGYNRDPNIKALKRRGFLNHGSTLLLSPLNLPGIRARLAGLGPLPVTPLRFLLEQAMCLTATWGFPKIRVPFLGVPIIRIIWVYIWVLLFLEPTS